MYWIWTTDVEDVSHQITKLGTNTTYKAWLIAWILVQPSHTAHLPHSSFAVEPEAVGGGKHQTESSVDRQLPVGDVYSPKLPCAFVTSVSGNTMLDK